MAISSSRWNGGISCLYHNFVSPHSSYPQSSLLFYSQAAPLETLYDSAHYLHHKNTNTGPFFGFSMHPIEHLIYLSGVIIPWIIPSHPFHAFYHLMVTGISPTWSHSGYDKIWSTSPKYKWNIITTCTTATLNVTTGTFPRPGTVYLVPSMMVPRNQKKS
ncbi:MAG: hypothetical protein Ct9H300mP28_28800 [Pseudomonadota bacterium]|nr:MAG: hypothetical protein Ct9H300mP28_28800 [Pseudomonadota bacterium]